MATSVDLGCLDCVAVLKAARTTQIEKWVHETDGGRWAVAQWDERAAQWTWHERPAPKHVQGYCYSFARSLSSVTRTYSSRAGAIASLPALRPAEHICGACEAVLRSAARFDELIGWNETEEREREEADALEAQRRHEAEEVALAEQDRRDAERLVAQDRAEQAAYEAAGERRVAAFWARLEPGATILGARDLSVIAVDREARRLTARTPKGAERVYGVRWVSETGTVTLGAAT